MAQNNCRPLGFGDNSDGVRFGIHSGSSLQPRGEVHPCSQRFKSQKGIAQRNSVPIRQECHSSCSLKSKRSRFLQHLLCCPQENRRIPSYSKFKATEQICTTQGFQTRFHSHYKDASSARGFHNFPGPEGCLQSHTNKRISSEISPLRVLGGSFSVQGSPFWPVVKPSSILQGACTGNRIPSCTGHSSGLLFRRRSDYPSVPISFETTHGTVVHLTNSVGVDPVEREIETGSEPGFCLYRGAVQYKVGQTEPNSAKNSRDTNPSGVSFKSKGSVSEVNFRDPGPHGIPDRFSAIKQTSHEESSVLSPEAMETQKRQYFKANFDLRECENRYKVVDGNTTFNPGGAIMVPNRGNLCHNRCLQDRLGGTLGGSDGPGHLEPRGDENAYKFVGNEGSDTCFHQMGTLLEDKVGTSAVGQCIGSPVYKQTGGNSVSSSVSASIRIMADSRGESISATSSSHSRDPQCSSRSVEQTEDQNLSNRMVTERNDCSENLASVLQASHRSICVRNESQITNVLLLAERPEGLGIGQLVNHVGGDAGIRFSPDSPDSQNSRPCVKVQLQNSTSCSEVATETMVHSDPQLTT